MRGFILMVVFLVSGSTAAAPIYHCHDDLGQPVFQDQPCVGITIEVINSQADNPNAKYGKSVLQALTQMTGQSEPDLTEPKMRQAAAALAATDAAKSYAFTQIYAVSAKHCGSEIQDKLDQYHADAAVIIALGRYYYKTGIKAKIGDRELSEPAEKLTAGLMEMTQKLEQEHQAADPDQLKRKCREASHALSSLTMLYGNE